MVHRREPREVIYLDRGGDASVKWLLWGAVLGAGVALLYAPRSGEETRRTLQRKLWKFRAMTEEKLDELTQQLGGARRASLADLEDEEELDEEDELEDPLEEEGPARGGVAGARQELERRLGEARARRRADAELEEPLA
ncbi:MAG TPA: YtxH domain-containing protein [Gemmatimonadales bacterium]|nr:YtxH domain-containing protein [Gemmatimonadales bacterium]